MAQSGKWIGTEGSLHSHAEHRLGPSVLMIAGEYAIEPLSIKDHRTRLIVALGHTFTSYLLIKTPIRHGKPLTTHLPGHQQQRKSLRQFSALRISGGLGPPFRELLMAPSSDASAPKDPVIAQD